MSGLARTIGNMHAKIRSVVDPTRTAGAAFTQNIFGKDVTKLAGYKTFDESSPYGYSKKTPKTLLTDDKLGG